MLIQSALDQYNSPERNLAKASARQIEDKGFVTLPGGHLAAALRYEPGSADWSNFAAAWNDLCLDEYMADGGRYRRRRYASFEAAHDEPIRRNTPQPHFQKLAHNPLNGGIERWFAPIEEQVINAPVWTSLLSFARTTFELCDPAATNWAIEAHQFRIDARPGETGLPTPEGPHRDGVDYVLMMLIDRRNVVGGTTYLTSEDGRKLAEVDLFLPGDAILLHDPSLHHGVSAISVQEQGKPAFRDTLVVTFSSQK